jgi:ElaB/YqjD/DUF883 family membrane-anchored ribosome-binding protein
MEIGMTSATTDLTDRVQSSVDRMAQSAHHAIDRVAGKAAPTVDQVRSAATHAGEAVSARLDEISTMQEELMESMRGQVRAHPLAIVGSAVLAGLLIGRLMRH